MSEDAEAPVEASAEAGPELVNKTVKKMDRALWERAVKACEARDELFGVWLARAIERALEVQSGDRIIFPGETRQTGGQTETPNQANLPQADRALAALLFTGLGQIADKKGCGGVAKRVRLALDLQVSAITGLPLPKPRERKPKAPAVSAEPPKPALPQPAGDARVRGID